MSGATDVTTGASASRQERLRLVVVGHVDHGKSTLIGRLLFDTGSMLDGKYEQLAAAAARRGVPFEWANLTDALQAERDQNVTIDTAQIWFKTPRREYVLIDAPGHKEFVANMVTGAAGADAALIIVDALEGVQEQSRRHGMLLKLLGIDQVAVIVNKLDLVDFSRDAFVRLSSEYRAFLSGIGITATAIVPISARHGDNVAASSARLSWYSGPTVLETLESFTLPAPDEGQPLRFPVQDVYRFDHRRILAGRVESGRVRVGDRVLFLPSGKHSTVKSIERWNAPAEDVAAAGSSIGLTLDEQIVVARGEVASLADAAPSLTEEFVARVFWLGRCPMVGGRRYRFKLVTQEFEGEVTRFSNVIDAATLDPIVGLSDAQLPTFAVGDVSIRTTRPVVVDAYARVPPLGRFVVVDALDVCGGGIVTEVHGQAGVMAAASGNLMRSASQVSRDERHARHGHRGAVVWLTGLSGSGKSTLANALERELFRMGWQAFVLDGDNIRYGLSANLGFSMADRAENIRRVAEVAKLFAESGTIAITAFISPYASDRARARTIMEHEGQAIPFVEVYLNTSVEVCEARDPKQLYAKARRGEIKEFTGVSAPFETPDRPDVTIDTAAVDVETAVAIVVDYLSPRLALRCDGGHDAYVQA